MNLEILEEIRERCNKATPGPWRGDRYDGSIKYEMHGAGKKLVLAVNHKEMTFGFTGTNSIADEDFVLHSREDVEWLLDKIDCLLTELDEALRTQE